MKKGDRVYYVPCLYEKGIPCRIENIETAWGKEYYIHAKTIKGELISDYATRFVSDKTEPYYMGGHDNV